MSGAHCKNFRPEDVLGFANTDVYRGCGSRAVGP